MVAAWKSLNDSLRRHRSPGNAFFHDLDQLVFSARGRGCPAELAFAQIGVGEARCHPARGIVQFSAIETSAVFDVGCRIAVLREERGRCEKE